MFGIPTDVALGKPVGKLASEKKCYEAVVAIPYTEKNGKKNFFPIISKKPNSSGISLDPAHKKSCGSKFGQGDFG